MQEFSLNNGVKFIRSCIIYLSPKRVIEEVLGIHKRKKLIRVLIPDLL